MNARDLPRASLEGAIEELAAMPAFVAAALEECGEALGIRPREGEFSLVEHACHLRDLEREGYLVRVRRMLAEERPDLAPFDGAAGAASRGSLPPDAHAPARDFAFRARALRARRGPAGDPQLARR